MKKQLRKIALAVVFAMTVALLAPAQQVAFAAARTFTYAEQKTGDRVTTLFMERGEKVDLKFIGISDYKNYKLKWVSSNEKVAVVDSNGVITALSDGPATATIRLVVGDSKDYYSMGVIVHVGKEQKVTIGTAAKTEIKSHTLELGKSVMLKANGLADNVGGRYVCTWTSTDPSVATVSSSGLVTTVAPGLTVIQLTVKKVSGGEVMVATPVALLVTAGGTSMPVATATPTPAPTVKPGVTATPTPTPVAVITATPTPTSAPVVETGNYSVTVTTDRSIALKFANAVEYTVSDFEFSELLSASDGDVLNKKDIASVEIDSTGKIVTITMVNKFTTGRYNIKVGNETQGRTFPVSIGVPNRMEIQYSCLGRTNTAYAYDDEIGIDVPIDISCKLYSGNIDVTESYIDNGGFIEYELITPTESDEVYLEGEQLYFYAPKRTAVLRATYTYYTESGATKEIKDTVSIISKEIGDYTITHVADWTIIDASDNNVTIDWDKTVKKVVADKDNFKVVALLADSYGYYYSTDPRGVDESKNIYSVDDENTLFALKGYTYAFNTSNDDYFYIDDNGDLYTYKAKQNAATYITLYNPDEWSSGERNIGAWQFTILEESKLNSVKLEETKISLLAQALDGFEERFCEADVVVTLYDQYGYEWTGEAYLEVSSSTSSVNDSIDAVTSIDRGDKDGEWILHIDAKNMYSLAKGKKNVNLTVTETDTKKKASISVQMQDPANAKDQIIVDDWAVGMKENTITFGDGELSEIDARAEIEIYQVSKTGDHNVGLITNGNVDEKDNVNLIKLQKDKNPSWSSAKAGEIYVLVLGPDNKIVEFAENEGDLGVWMDKATGEVSVNLTNSEDNNITCMKEGKYTVKITKINKDGGGSKKMHDTAFTVIDNTSDVTFTGLKSSRTELDVSGENDPTAAEIVLELCNFRLGGASWTTVTENMITKVNYELRNGGKKMFIESVEFAVPADGKSESGVVTYKKTVKVGKTVSINMED